MAVRETDTAPRRQPGTDDDRSKQGGGIGAVFYVTTAVTVLFVALGVLFTDPFNQALTKASDMVISNLGWLYLLITMSFLVFALYLAFSRFGNIKLGRPDEKPAFGLFPWFAMLFQAGMGVGLIFWGVSEPLSHYGDPPFGLAQPKTPEAADNALQYAFFHWTLHPWGIYAVVGLAVAYFSYRRGVNDLRISSALRPLLGDRVDGPIGVMIDVLAIIATLFGVAVSLGLGTLQLDAGLGEAFGLTSGITLQLIIIGVTTAAYLISASTPLEKGINWLSQASMVLAAVALVAFFILGPTVLQLNAMTQEIGRYLSQLVPMSLRMEAFSPDPWLGDWTIFFWATWIAWAPYVGVFIARISRGRTIRQFVLGVLIAPSIFSLIWFSVFGTTAIDLDDRLGGRLSKTAANDESIALFKFLQEYPVPIGTSILFLLLVWIFFVAGADAGTVVLGSMSAGGTPEPKRFIRLVWGGVMAALAALLLVAGGLDALQSGAILAATPFGLVMVALCWSLQKTLSADYRESGQRGGERPRDQAKSSSGASSR